MKLLQKVSERFFLGQCLPPVMKPEQREQLEALGFSYFPLRKLG